MNSPDPKAPRVTIPEVVARFRAYYEAHPAWGVLHVVLDDQNIADADVQYCVEYAMQQRDAEGEALARILLSMSKTQRRKLGRVV